jgi:hypothetical protein
VTGQPRGWGHRRRVLLRPLAGRRARRACRDVAFVPPSWVAQFGTLAIEPPGSIAPPGTGPAHPDWADWMPDPGQAVQLDWMPGPGQALQPDRMPGPGQAVPAPEPPVPPRRWWQPPWPGGLHWLGLFLLDGLVSWGAAVAVAPCVPPRPQHGRAGPRRSLPAAGDGALPAPGDEGEP